MTDREKRLLEKLAEGTLNTQATLDNLRRELHRIWEHLTPRERRILWNRPTTRSKLLALGFVETQIDE